MSFPDPYESLGSVGFVVTNEVVELLGTYFALFEVSEKREVSLKVYFVGEWN